VAVASAGLPPLSGFVGKLLVLEAARGQMAVVWTVILLSSLVMVMGFARAGSALFWKPVGEVAPTPRAPLLPVVLLVAGLAALTVLAGPAMRYMEATAADLHDPAAYVAAVLARAGE
jgi:multicomponent K+:H+ antiporter subunit D